MMLVMYIIFDSPFVGNFFWTSNLLIMQGLSGMCFGKFGKNNYYNARTSIFILKRQNFVSGFLISVVSDTMNAASFMGIGSFFPLCSMSGK